MGYIKRIGPKRYRIRYDVVPQNGRQRQLKCETLDDVTKGEAEAIYAERKAAVARERKLLAEGQEVKDEITIEGLFERFLAIKQQQREANTVDRYESLVRLYIVPAFGQIRVRDLKSGLCMRKYADWAQIGPKGRVISAKTIHHVHDLLRNGLNWGIRAELLTRNVAALIARDDLPKVVETKPIALDREELLRVLECAKNPTPRARARGTLSAQSWFHPAVALVAYTGVRRGECLAVRWSRVDLEKKEVVIDLELTEDMRLKLPKDDESRTIALGDTLCDILREHRLAQEKEKAFAGSAYRDQDFVFASWDGSPIPPWNFGRAVRDLIRRAGVTAITLHGLRDTHASLLGLAGVPIEVTSERLGHSTIDITKKRYTHIYRERDADAADRLDRKMRG